MTATEMGEYAVGAWLREVVGCDFVNYNVRPPVSGQEGQYEFDVVGFHFGKRVAYLCEAGTHLEGLNYGGYAKTFERVRKKHKRQRAYASRYLREFKTHRFMLWSPRVPVGKLSKILDGLDKLELVINGEYTARMREPQERARASTRDTGNPFFRALQIVEHLRTGKDTDAFELRPSVKRAPTDSKLPSKGAKNGDSPQRTAKKKVRAAKPNPEKAAKSKKAAPKPIKRETSGAFLRRVLVSGSHNDLADKVLAEIVRRHFPNRTTTSKDVQWNRWKLRKDGLLPPVTKRRHSS